MRNGSLYYNKVLDRVERMIGVVSKVRVLTYYHKQDEKTVQVKNLRKATGDEVKNYLNPPQARIKNQFSRIGSHLKSD